jgi:hypothetical protein
VTKCYFVSYGTQLSGGAYMSDQLLEVFTGFLHPSDKQDELLNPIRCLEEVVYFEPESHFSHWVIDPKVFRLEPYTSILF